MTNTYFLTLPNGHYVLASGFALSWLYSGNASEMGYFEPWNLIIIHSFAAAQIYDDVYTFKVAAIRALPSRSSTSSTVKTMSRRPPSGWGRGSPCTMWPPSPWKHQSMAGLVAHGSGPTKANCWISAKARPVSSFIGRAGWTWSSFGGCLYGVPKVKLREAARAATLV